MALLTLAGLTLLALIHVSLPALTSLGSLLASLRLSALILRARLAALAGTIGRTNIRARLAGLLRLLACTCRGGFSARVVG
jgi:hypothetical protein